MKKIVGWGLALTMLLSGCNMAQSGNASGEFAGYARHEKTLPQAFDVITTVIAYTKSEKDFMRYTQIIEEKLRYLHGLFDIYHDVEGQNTLKTVNDNAGVAPVEVDRQLIDLLLFCQDAYQKTDGAVNVALGPVLTLWHDARETAMNDIDKAYVPAIEDLQQAQSKTDIAEVIIDSDKNTVFLAQPGMSLDVGAVAKGYAVELALDDAKVAGLDSCVVNAGGNVVAVGRPMDANKETWSIGVQDPTMPTTLDSNQEVRTIADALYATDKAVVTSGNYQRFYQLDGVNYHHIIDPKTLMPATGYRAVTVVCDGSAIGDMLSTALFLLPIEKGKTLLSRYGADAIWVLEDGTVEATEGYRAISKLFQA